MMGKIFFQKTEQKISPKFLFTNPGCVITGVTFIRTIPKFQIRTQYFIVFSDASFSLPVNVTSFKSVVDCDDDVLGLRAVISEDSGDKSLSDETDVDGDA